MPLPDLTWARHPSGASRRCCGGSSRRPRPVTSWPCAATHCGGHSFTSMRPLWMRPRSPRAGGDPADDCSGVRRPEGAWLGDAETAALRIPAGWAVPSRSLRLNVSANGPAPAGASFLRTQAYLDVHEASAVSAVRGWLSGAAGRAQGLWHRPQHAPEHRPRHA